MRILLLNQTFPPDVVSSAQHAGDLAHALRAAGHDVTVVASRRAYDTPAVTFPATEDWRGVKVLRVSGTGFGKTRRWRRAVDFATFLSTCFLRLLVLPRFDVVIAMTSPPLISFVAAIFARLRGGRLILWVLDLNPDEAIAAGWLRDRTVAARALGWCLAYSLRQAKHVVVLDRFMKQRVEAKLRLQAGAHDSARLVGKISVVPPWSHDSAVRHDPEGRQEFRRTHDLDRKFVVMYSGNHSPCHPLQTLLDAAHSLRDDAEIVFCFIGGGSEFGRVKRFADEHGLQNVLCLPYQPLEDLSASLSAADLHVVVMGDQFVGILHPCKIYNILRLGIPFLYVGPRRSHVADLFPGMSDESWARQADHGQVHVVAAHIRQAAAERRERSHAAILASERFSQDHLSKQLVKIIEAAGDRMESARTERSAYARR